MLKLVRWGIKTLNYIESMIFHLTVYFWLADVTTQLHRLICTLTMFAYDRNKDFLIAKANMSQSFSFNLNVTLVIIVHAIKILNNVNFRKRLTVGANLRFCTCSLILFQILIIVLQTYYIQGVSLSIRGARQFRLGTGVPCNLILSYQRWPYGPPSGVGVQLLLKGVRTSFSKKT